MTNNLWVLDFMDRVQKFYSHDPDLTDVLNRMTAETLEDYAKKHNKLKAFKEAKRMGKRDAKADKELH